uniref:Uncharacterized protein n=1 Tax=Cryptococcus bacillisporus CA1280 TaxID=1296109 RepID=A0A0D0TER1_CRYGA|nr:hypothetical protein I312_05875 [Cryptococcus bacillisporus CA1280]
MPSVMTLPGVMLPKLRFTSLATNPHGPSGFPPTWLPFLSRWIDGQIGRDKKSENQTSIPIRYSPTWENVPV